MAVTATTIGSGIPVADSQFIIAHASGTALAINPGSYVAWSGNYIIEADSALASWKASGVGIALTRNPEYDWAGRQVVNSAVVIARYGQFRVSAAFSGKPLYGVLAHPVSTGSAVNSPSGVTGAAATWNTAAPVAASGATSVAQVLGIATVINWYNSGPAGTGQLDIVLWDRNADLY